MWLWWAETIKGTEQISPGSYIRGKVEAAWCAIYRAAAKRLNIIIIEGDAWNGTIAFAKTKLILSLKYQSYNWGYS